MASKTLVVANWKMNPSSAEEARRLFEVTKKAAGQVRGVKAVVAPPVVFLPTLARGQRGRGISFAVQNAHFELAGAHTGEISMTQAESAGAAYVLIGHAERRAIGETDNDVRMKVRAALAAGITPIVCIGEKKRSESGEYLGVIKEQIHAAFTNVPHKKVSDVVIAYEPVWAIGAEEAMTSRNMQEMSIFIRKCIAEVYAPANIATFPLVLYGGAVDADNARDMRASGDVAGFLVGRASTDIKKIAALFNALR